MSYPTGPLRVTPEQWADIKHHYEDGDWDDVIEAEELGLDEPRCPRCGVPSTGLCIDCDPPDDHDRRFDDYYSTREGDVGDQAFDLDNPPW